MTDRYKNIVNNFVRWGVSLLPQPITNQTHRSPPGIKRDGVFFSEKTNYICSAMQCNVIYYHHKTF